MKRLKGVGEPAIYPRNINLRVSLEVYLFMYRRTLKFTFHSSNIASLLKARRASLCIAFAEEETNNNKFPCRTKSRFGRAKFARQSGMPSSPRNSPLPQRKNSGYFGSQSGSPFWLAIDILAVMARIARDAAETLWKRFTVHATNSTTGILYRSAPPDPTPRTLLPSRCSSTRRSPRSCSSSSFATQIRQREFPLDSFISFPTSYLLCFFPRHEQCNVICRAVSFARVYLLDYLVINVFPPPSTR